MSDKQIGEYPLNIKIVSGSYEIANIEAHRHPQAKTDNTNYTQPTII